MRFTKTLKYNLKRALPILTIAGAGLMASCDKDDDMPQRDVELEFYESPFGSNYEAISIENLKQLASDSQVANIYMKVTDKNTYEGYGVKGYKRLRDYMAERTSISPKIRGRGNFKFAVGECEKEDSLWFVRQGWTINQHLQNQK